MFDRTFHTFVHFNFIEVSILWNYLTSNLQYFLSVLNGVYSYTRDFTLILSGVARLVPSDQALLYNQILNVLLECINCFLYFT